MMFWTVDPTGKIVSLQPAWLALCNVGLSISGAGHINKRRMEHLIVLFQRDCNIYNRLITHLFDMTAYQISN